MANKCCRYCEFWWPGSLEAIGTAHVAECLCAKSDLSIAPFDHWCEHYSEDAERVTEKRGG